MTMPRHQIPERHSSDPRGCLPTLPFELKFSILTQIPLVQVFTLRRVSHAWNDMLSDPILLEEINQQLPFITSALDLTSRMKRRMRMARKDPLWIKPIREVFPWTKEIFPDPERAFVDMFMKLWKRWAVIMYRPRGYSELSTIFKLRIEDLGKRGEYPAVEVDVWKQFQASYPDAYRRYIAFDDDGHPVGIAHDISFEFWETDIVSIEDGKAVVVLNVSGRQDPMGDINSTSSYRDKETFFFIYSIPTGILIQNIYHKHPFRTQSLEWWSASQKHFVVSCRAARNAPPPPDCRIPHAKLFTAHCLFVYSLHDGSLVQQIRIVFPRDMFTSDYVKLTEFPSFWFDNSRCSYQFDHMDRIWVPSHLGEPSHLVASYFGTGNISQPETPTVMIPLCDMPKVTCGSTTWTIVPTVPVGSERDMCRKINFHHGIKNEADDKIERRYKTLVPVINIHDQHLCLLELQKDYTPLASTAGLGTIWDGRENPELKLRVHTFRTSQYLHHAQHDEHLNIDFGYKVESRTYSKLHLLDGLQAWCIDSAAWGFIVKDCTWSGYPDCPETAMKDFMEFCLLPFHHNDLCFDGCRQQEPRPLVDPSHTDYISEQPAMHEDNEQHPPAEEENSNLARMVLEETSMPESELARSLQMELGISPMWVDDSIVALGVAMGSGPGELWLVCYEEKWAI